MLFGVLYENIMNLTHNTFVEFCDYIIEIFRDNLEHLVCFFETGRNYESLDEYTKRIIDYRLFVHGFKKTILKATSRNTGYELYWKHRNEAVKHQV